MGCSTKTGTSRVIRGWFPLISETQLFADTYFGRHELHTHCGIECRRLRLQLVHTRGDFILLKIFHASSRHHARGLPDVEFHSNANEVRVERPYWNPDADADGHRPRQMTGDDAVDRRMARQQKAETNQIVHEVQSVLLGRFHSAEKPVGKLLQRSARGAIQSSVVRQYGKVPQETRPVKLAESLHPDQTDRWWNRSELCMEASGHMADLLQFLRRVDANLLGTVCATNQVADGGVFLGIAMKILPAAAGFVADLDGGGLSALRGNHLMSTQQGDLHRFGRIANGGAR